MGDEQDVAESVDEETVGSDPVTSDEVGAFDDAPDSPVGLPFADADVTDESLAERAAREIPEVIDVSDEPVRLVEPEVLVDSDLLEQVDEDGDIAEPD
jgi:hypothetical protein